MQDITGNFLEGYTGNISRYDRKKISVENNFFSILKNNESFKFLCKKNQKGTKYFYSLYKETISKEVKKVIASILTLQVIFLTAIQTIDV